MEAQLEQQLNDAIVARGYRISPRTSLEERMARYVHNENRDAMDLEDARIAVTLLHLKYRGNKKMILESILGNRPERVEETELSRTNMNVTTRRIQMNSGHPMMRRSQTKGL